MATPSPVQLSSALARPLIAIGREVTKTGSRDLSGDATPTTGYTIVSAESMEAAEKLLAGVPIDDVRIYEALPM